MNSVAVFASVTKLHVRAVISVFYFLVREIRSLQGAVHSLHQTAF